jgi:ATP-dependent exoDNAse (exonuclease V) alpha subunit
VCLRNSDRLGVKNGTRGTVEEVDQKRGALFASTDRGDRVALTSGYVEAGHVRHGYALTGHSSQGVTVERAFVLGKAETRLQEWGYVALSRAREETRLYITGMPLEPESQFHELDDRDPIGRMAQALEESAIERLAVDQRPLPSGPRHRTRTEIERPELGERDHVRRRLLERQRLATLGVRESAERALTQAEERLDRLPRLGSGRRRANLRAEIARERSAIRLADEKLASLRRSIGAATSRQTLRRDATEPENGRQQNHGLRQADDLSLGL